MPYRYIRSMEVIKSIDLTCDGSTRTGHRARGRADARCRRRRALKLRERTCAPGRLDSPARFSPYSFNDVHLSPCRLALAPLARSGSGMWLHALITATLGRIPETHLRKDPGMGFLLCPRFSATLASHLSPLSATAA